MWGVVPYREHSDTQVGLDFLFGEVNIFPGRMVKKIKSHLLAGKLL